MGGGGGDVLCIFKVIAVIAGTQMNCRVFLICFTRMIFGSFGIQASDSGHLAGTPLWARHLKELLLRRGGGPSLPSPVNVLFVY